MCATIYLKLLTQCCTFKQAPECLYFPVQSFHEFVLCEGEEARGFQVNLKSRNKIEERFYNILLSNNVHNAALSHLLSFKYVNELELFPESFHKLRALLLQNTHSVLRRDCACSIGVSPTLRDDANEGEIRKLQTYLENKATNIYKRYTDTVFS